MQLEIQKSEKIAFLTWLVAQVDAGRAQAHHLQAIQSYMHSYGLSDNEAAEDFEKAFIRYGAKPLKAKDI